jgi:hypothetical protein
MDYAFVGRAVFEMVTFTEEDAREGGGIGER